MFGTFSKKHRSPNRKSFWIGGLDWIRLKDFPDATKGWRTILEWNFYPQKLTWIPKIAIFERRYMLKTIILGYLNVRFRGGRSNYRLFPDWIGLDWIGKILPATLRFGIPKT